jgi:hypothetical protein
MNNITVQHQQTIEDPKDVVWRRFNEETREWHYYGGNRKRVSAIAQGHMQKAGLKGSPVFTQSGSIYSATFKG